MDCFASLAMTVMGLVGCLKFEYGMLAMTRSLGRPPQPAFVPYADRNIRVALSITSVMRSDEGGGAA